MKMETRRTAIHILGAVILAAGGVSRADGQNYLTASPSPANAGVFPAGVPGGGTPDSVNPVSGNVGLSIPLARIPGPGGFGPAVTLSYNSAYYTLYTDVSLGYLREMYENRLNDGGWSYGYRYSLWGAQMAGTGISPGWSTYLTTPDGGNHLLLLVSAAPASGAQAVSTFQTYYSGQPIYDVRFDGACVQTTLPCNNQKPANNFAGKLVFASADSSYIRVEADTVAQTWVAHFADGSSARGSLSSLGLNYNSDADTVSDRNGNSFSISGSCLEGAQPAPQGATYTPACTTTLSDPFGRSITIAYTSENNFPYDWKDTISQPGVNGANSAVVHWMTRAAGGLSYDCTYVNASTFNQCGLSDAVINPYVVQSVQLPPASSGGPFAAYTFGYEAAAPSYSWGELHSVTRAVVKSGQDPIAACPNGGSSNCTHLYDIAYNYYFDDTTNHHRVMGTPINPVASRTITHGIQDGTGASPPPETTTYSIPVRTSFDPTKPPPAGGTSTVGAPDGGTTTIESAQLPSCASGKTGFCPALVFKVVSPDGSYTESGWASASQPMLAPAGGFYNPYLAYSIQTVNGTSAASRGIHVAQDSNGNTISTTEYEWSNPAAITRSAGFVTGFSGASARMIATPHYGSGSNYWDTAAPAYLRAKQSVTVGTLTTSFTYDGATSPTKGNVTKAQTSDSSSTAASASQYWSYLANGNVSDKTDANGNRTLFCYDAANLYPTARWVAADVTDTCASVASLALTPGSSKWKTGYAYYSNSDGKRSGLLQTETDSNNSITTTYSYDNLGRQINASQQGGSLNRYTATNYDDWNLTVEVTRDDVGAQTLKSTTYYDGLGRTVKSRDAAGNTVQRGYRFGAGGSYELVSNPYVTSAGAWTLTVRDTMGRVTGIRRYATNMPAPWGANSATTGAVGILYNQTNTNCKAGAVSIPAVTTTDEASNVRTQCMDGPGRLQYAIEPDGTVVQYWYDATDNLTQVKMGGQTRGFAYEFGRLKQSCNPETGADCTQSPLPIAGGDRYTYDANGNVSTRTDARGRVTSYPSYDALNRPSGISYSDGTAGVTYSYDSDFKGTVASVTATKPGVSYKTEYTHDALGRINGSTQTTGSNGPYVFGYQYSKTDRLSQITYPTGRKVNYVPDTAGRINSIQNDANQANYASAIGYTAAGNVSSLTLGNGITEQPSWNDRLQMTGLSASLSSANLLQLGLYPCANQLTSCASGNTGSLQSQTIAGPGIGMTQSYSYDPVNRLSSAGEGAGSWSQTFGYDDGNGHNRGNMYVATHSGYQINNFTPVGASNFDNSNRLSVQSAGYDTAGNQTAIGGFGQAFDAEGRMTSVTVNGATVNYVYDGEGRRVMQQGASGTTVFAYDAFGNLAAEYSPVAAASVCGTATCYVTVDHLGSTRMVTDSAGAVKRRYDYFPFGEEIPAGVGGRTLAMGYQAGPDGFGPKFTGQYRDTLPDGTLTGYDYFNARYYSPAQGRFTSPDPGNAGADVGDPQSWNGYAYVGNNPVNVTDPSGESWITAVFGAIGFIAGAVTAQPWAIWWSTAIMTGATAAGAEYSFEKAVNSGSIAAIAGMFIGGPNTLPDYGSQFIIFDWEKWKNGRVELPNGDVAIYGYLGEGAPILKAAGERATHDVGCAANSLFPLSIFAGGEYYSHFGDQTILKPFQTPGATKYTSVLSKAGRASIFSDVKIGMPCLVKGANGWRWSNTGNMGSFLGRTAPIAGKAMGIGGVVLGAVQMNACLIN